MMQQSIQFAIFFFAKILSRFLCFSQYMKRAVKLTSVLIMQLAEQRISYLPGALPLILFTALVQICSTKENNKYNSKET